MPRYFRNTRYDERQPYRDRGNVPHDDYYSYRGRGNSRGRGRGSSRSRGRGRGWSRGGSRDRYRSNSVTQTLTRLGLNEEQIRTVLNLRDGTQNFDDSSNLCYQYAKIYNQKQNWQKLPKSLQNALDRFINNIHLPMNDSYSRDEIKDASTEFSDRLCEIVRFHLLQQSESLVEKLKRCHIDDIRSVQEDTSRRLKPRFSRTFIENCWSALDADMQETAAPRSPVTYAVPQPTGPINTVSKSIAITAFTASPAASVSAQPSKTAAVDTVVSTHKVPDVETASSIPSGVVVVNQPIFTAPAMQVDMDHGIRPAQASPTGPAAPAVREGVKRFHTPDHDQTTSKHGRLQPSDSSPISVHSADSQSSEGILTDDNRENINRWNIGKIPIKCNTVIIGDSNLVNWEVKERCYIKSFRGAHIIDLTRILVNWDPPSHVSRLVIAAGVNNYSDTNAQNYDQMEELLTILDSFSFEKYFVEIHISPKHTDVAHTRLQAINTKATEAFGSNFIKLKMIMKFADMQHYDKETASAIAKHVYHFLQ